MSTSHRFLALGLTIGLTAGALAGAGLAGSGLMQQVRAAAPSSSAAAGTGSGVAPAGASGVTGTGSGTTSVATDTGTAATAGTGTAATGSGSATASVGVATPGIASIAYPVYPGSPGLAPDHTIVVTGVGQATLKSDASDRTAAQNRAIAAALSDAKSQAQAIAAGTGLTLGSVLSASATVSPGYGVMPMPACAPAEPSGGASNGPAVGAPEPACPPEPYQQTLTVSVTVEYAVH